MNDPVQRLQFGFNAAKPFLQYQAMMLRLWANNFELIARNYEKGVEAFGSAAKREMQEPEQQRAA